MIEEKILKDLGLTDVEARVYLACLELGSDTVLNISKKAGVKRPTCYLALDNLLARGLASKVQKKSTTLYLGESPNIILNKYKEKIANFEDLLPYFEAKFNRGPKPKIRYYEGKEQLYDVYLKQVFPRTKEIYFFGTDVAKFFKIWPDIFNIWVRNFSDECKSKELVSYDKKGLEYARKNAKKRPIRVMPKDLPVFSDSIITDDKLFIVSLDNLFGVLIESEDLAKTYKNFFLLAWKGAEEV